MLAAEQRHTTQRIGRHAYRVCLPITQGENMRTMTTGSKLSTNDTNSRSVSDRPRLESAKLGTRSHEERDLAALVSGHDAAARGEIKLVLVGIHLSGL